jgi:hypothetical protein
MKEQTYYHYLASKFAICDLRKERIRVSTLETLNDPFEMMPYRRYEFEKRKSYIKVFREVKRKWGLLCFSPSWEEQLLWAHYADGHKGIALGFEILKDVILKLTYTPNQIRTQFDLTANPEENEKKFLSLAKVKYKEWLYEKEHRILVKLENCVLDDSLYFLPFGDRLKLKVIVLGCKFNHDKNMGNILELKNKFNAKVIATRPGWEDYRIHKDGSKTSQYN